jgi:predicted membrane-bound spermidine synthase
MARALALLLTVFTGFTGLVYEVTWQRLLATLLGSQSEATAAILAIFLGGLSLGYALFGRVTQAALRRAAGAGRPPRLLRLYGCVEAGIGLWALAFPTLFGVAERISVALPHGSGSALGFGFDLLLTVLLIGVPTVLMGGTIPILTQALARGIDDATRFHALVYASNTAGAFAGALAAGFVLVPWLGLVGVLFAMGGMNLAAGAGFVLLGGFEREPAAGASPGPIASQPGGAPRALAASAPPAFAACALAALLSGFAMMAVQTVLNRIGALTFGASQFTFAMTVAVFVLCIALGSLVVSRLRTIPPGVIAGSQWLLVALLAGVYLQIENAPYAAHVLRTLFRDEDAGFYPYFVSAFLLLLLFLLLPIGLAGATLPLLFHHLRREVADLGGVAGRLYSWNTAGSLLGAILGGYLLLLWLDLHHVFRIALAALAVSATILSVRVLGASWAKTLALGLLPALAGIVLLPTWRPERLEAGLFRSREALPASYRGPDALYRANNAGMVLRFHDDDPVSSVAVFEVPKSRLGFLRSIVNNGKSDGSIPGDYPTMALLGLLPALIAEEPKRALVIGYGTGTTVGELASLPTMESVDVAEISPGVIAAAPLFDAGNRGASRNPKVHIHRTDAYRFLLRSDQKWDVIVSEPSNPWVTGVEMLFSREFLEAARSHLTPGGVYAQWFHRYETDEETTALVLRTYDAVFDHVAVWWPMAVDMILLGIENPSRARDIAALEERATSPPFQEILRRIGIPGFAGLLGHEVLPLDVLRASGLEGDLHTLLHPILSHRAARAFFRGSIATLPVVPGLEAAQIGAENSLLGRHLAANGGKLPEVEWKAVVSEACNLEQPSCATLLLRFAQEHPGSPALAEIQARASGVAGTIAPDSQALLEQFLGLRPLPPGRVSLEAATRATDVFTRFYHHAAPFDRSVLARIWDLCHDEQGGGCLAGREQAAVRLGRLERSATTQAQAADAARTHLAPRR